MKPILFYDGDCKLCNRSIRFLQQQDTHKRLCYQLLQSTTAKELLPKNLTDELSTAVYKPNDRQLFLRSDAVLHALIDTGSHWKVVAGIALLIPRCLRDLIYNRVAHNRNRCKLPQ